MAICRGISKKHLSFVDLLSLLLLSIMIIAIVNGRGDITNHVKQVFTVFFSFYLARFICVLFPVKSQQFALLLVLLVTVIQDITGLIQFVTLGHDTLKNLRGTFANSGSYAGFLSMCSCILFAYYELSDGKGRKIAFYVALTTCLLISATTSRAALLGMGVSIFVLIGNTEKGKKFLARFGIILLIIGLFAATLLYLIKKGSADGRFFIDKICFRIIRDNGVFGSGLGSFQEIFISEQASYFQNAMSDNFDNLNWLSTIEKERLSVDCVHFAFNEYLQLGIEAGFLSMFLFVIIVLYSLVVSYRNNNMWFYGLISISIFAFFSYPLHILLFQIAVPFIMALCISISRNDKAYVITELPFVLVLMIIGLFVSVNQKEVNHNTISYEEKKKVLSLHSHEYYDIVIEQFDGKNYVDLVDYECAFAYGQSLNKVGLYEKSDSVLMIGIKISCDPMFWNVMGNNSLAQGKYREAEERYKHAFYMVPNRLYPLVLLAKLYYAEGDTARFLKMTDVVENFVPKVESIRTENLRAEIRELKNSYLSELEEKNED